MGTRLPLVDQYIVSRRGAVGAAARSRITNATRLHREAAAMANANPTQAAALLTEAEAEGERALRQAQDDIDSWGGYGSPMTGFRGLDPTALILGGILGGAISGGLGGTRGGGWGGSRGGFGGFATAAVTAADTLAGVASEPCTAPSDAAATQGRMNAMTSFITHTTVDCGNAYELSEWWKQVLGYADLEGDPNEAGHEECLIVSPTSGHRLLFIEVPDEKRGKNRIHFDIQPHTGTRDEEVQRVVTMGAKEVADQRDHYGPGIGWVVLQDPEGNEFCILRSEEERAAAPMRQTP